MAHISDVRPLDLEAEDLSDEKKWPSPQVFAILSRMMPSPGESQRGHPSNIEEVWLENVRFHHVLPIGMSGVGLVVVE